MKGEKSVQGQPAVPEDSPKREEVTIKFGKGLVGEPFISKAGKELVEIKIPNRDARDHRPWESFVVSPKMVHENQYGAGVWMKSSQLTGQQRFPVRSTRAGMKAGKVSGEPNPELCPIRS